nr:RagB/SusD family nutrient uptake outer membrane protein [Pedobacter ghigonis]
MINGLLHEKACRWQLNLTTGQTSQHNYVYFRLAEMLLNYAEAKNEAEGPVTDVYTAVNRVRSRVAMPNLPAGLSQTQMRERIRNERRIELAFEGHRFWDTRRWNTAKELFNGPFYGMKVTKTATGFTYLPYQVENRIFREYMNLYPFQQRELLANPKLIQNPGWSR